MQYLEPILYKIECNNDGKYGNGDQGAFMGASKERLQGFPKRYHEIAGVYLGGTRRSQERVRVPSGGFSDSRRSQECFRGYQEDSRGLMGYQGSYSGLRVILGGTRVYQEVFWEFKGVSRGSRGSQGRFKRFRGLGDFRWVS